MMIPEAAGATPFGIFLLADAYLRSAELTATEARLLTQGPTRLLAYHAAELFLKTYLRSSGELVTALRSYGHDLHAMIVQAKARGLQVPPELLAQAAKMRDKNDYVRVRYVVTEVRSDISPTSVLMFVTKLRECVRQALDFDEYGNPLGALWLGEEPDDYVKAGLPAFRIAMRIKDED